ncbi:MAG TPA: hypothetical protein VFW42_09990 [Fluviicoccus sp.]|nr:hypothetical protein [Fluviicoccus sp.]
MFKALLLTLFLLGIAGLSLFALGEGIRTGRAIHFAQAVGAMIPAAVGLRTMAAFWLDWWRHRLER